MGIFSDNARQLWECGYSIIPLNGKRPFLENWNQFRDRLPTETEIDEWESKYPEANIGLVTGPASGLCWVDIDTRDQELTNKIINILPPTPLRRFGAKGMALGYRWTPHISHRIMYYKEMRLGEILVNTQIVLPPSIHPDTGRAYQYVGCLNLGGDFKAEELSDVPELTDAHFQNFEQRLENDKFEIKDLETIAGRNDKLKSIVGAMITRGLPVDEIAQRILVADMEMHADHPSGPLFSDTGEYKDMAKIPKACAWKFAANVFSSSMRAIVQRGEEIPQFKPSTEESAEPTEYEIYKMFFDKKFKNCRKDMISKHMLRWDGSMWQSVVENLDALKSYGIDVGLKPNKIPIHIDRYIMNRPEQLLVNIAEWDGVDRIEQLRQFIRFKNQEFSIFEDAFKEWGANIFRRLYDNSAQNRCLILKGGQHMGKDYFVKSMLKDGFAGYFKNFTVTRNEADCWTQVTNNLVLHLEEFDQTGVLTVPFLKDLITREWANYRLPYGRAAVNRKCVGSFISTVNIDTMLRDETGNRRFAVFEVESIDWSYPKDWSIQIVAQFFALYKADHKAQPETWLTIKTGNAEFEQIDMVDDYLGFWDERLQALGRSAIGGMKKEFTLNEVHPVIVDLQRLMNARSDKAILGMLRRNNRVRHSKHGRRYFAASNP